MTGFVYFIGYAESAWVKIGYATNVKHRLAMLQTSTHEDLAVEAVVASPATGERRLHKVVGERRREWFKRPDVTGLIAMANDGASIEDIITFATERMAAIKEDRQRERDEREVLCAAITASDPRCESSQRQAREFLASIGESHRETPDLYKSYGVMAVLFEDRPA